MNHYNPDHKGDFNREPDIDFAPIGEDDREWQAESLEAMLERTRQELRRAKKERQ